VLRRNATACATVAFGPAASVCSPSVLAVGSGGRRERRPSPGHTILSRSVTNPGPSRCPTECRGRLTYPIFAGGPARPYLLPGFAWRLATGCAKVPASTLSLSQNCSSRRVAEDQGRQNRPGCPRASRSTTAPGRIVVESLIPKVGLEPTPSCEDRILSPVRLPYSWYWKHVAVILKGFDCRAVTILP
jgi:hypothetical protein